MKFMMIVKANKDSEAGAMPSQELIDAMGKYNEDLMRAGVLVDGAGLQPSSKGSRIHYSGGRRIVTDGPFAETKELIAGYWVIQVNSKQEAMEWALRAPAPFGEDQEGELEIRQFFELEDFPPSETIDREREIAAELAKRR